MPVNTITDIEWEKNIVSFKNCYIGNALNK